MYDKTEGNTYRPVSGFANVMCFLLHILCLLLLCVCSHIGNSLLRYRLSRSDMTSVIFNFPAPAHPSLAQRSVPVRTSLKQLARDPAMPRPRGDPSTG